MTLKREKIEELLNGVKEGRISVEEALADLSTSSFHDLEFARVDIYREKRKGVPEVIFCQGKTVDQVVSIARSIVEHGSNLLGTRADPEIYQAVREVFPQTIYNPVGRIFRYQIKEVPQVTGRVAIITAGTTDIPVAEEAAETLSALGCSHEKLYDVGVAGIHRLFSHQEVLERASVIIAIAGMEGALASVVGGIVSCPVIGVPTSVGYGANLGGFSALLTMLNSCAQGIAVVNIDNGFGAAVLAHAILNVGNKSPRSDSVS